MSDILELHKALVSEEIEKAIKKERKRILTELEKAHLIEWHHDHYCDMCEATNTNAWATGCVMNPVIRIIKGDNK